MRLLYVIGTRPNFVKTAPVIGALRERLPDARHTIVHTGQHYDRLMSEVFLEELGVPAPDFMLEVGSGSHAAQTARTMERLEPVLEDERPDLVVVPGDVNSTLAAALTAVKMGIAGRPRRVGAAQLRPDDARGGQPDRRRPLRLPSLPPQRGRGRQPARGRDRRGAHALRRQHDDRHPGGAGRPLPRRRRRRPGRGRARLLRPRHPAPAGAGRRPAAGRDGAPAGGAGAAHAGRLPGPPADPQDDGGGRRRPPAACG